jgi:uncharacterized protein YukE
MSRDIDVDIDELEKFIEVLNRFQDQTTDKLRGVQTAWNRCDETWQGEAKEDFTKGFEQTEAAVRRALEAGEDAARWLQKFQEILQDMLRYR